MGWFLPLISLASSVLGAKSASKEASRRAAQEAAAQQKADARDAEMLALARNQDARARTAFDRYSSVYQPIEDRYLRQLQRPVDYQAEADMAGADVERQIGTSRGTLSRALARRGLRSNSAAAADAESRLALGAARLKAAAMTGARRRGVTDSEARLAAAAGLGQRQFANAMSLQSGATAGLSDVYNAARSDRANAQVQSQLAARDRADAYGAIGSTLADLPLEKLKLPAWF